MTDVNYENELGELVQGDLRVLLFENGTVGVFELIGDIPGFSKLERKSSLGYVNRFKLNNALEGAPKIKYKYGTQILQTPKDFFNELGDEMYDIIFTDGSYVKFDNSNGRMLYVVDGKQYFVRYPTAFMVENVEAVMRDKVDRLRNYLGLNGPQELVFNYGLGTAMTGGGNKITIIGKMDDTRVHKDQFGYFKHSKVGENGNGVNLLNMPDPYWIPLTWYADHNQDWMIRAIERGDDFYLASPIDGKSLYNTKKDGKTIYGSYYANELNELVLNGVKPANITQIEWEALKPDIIEAANTLY